MSRNKGFPWRFRLRIYLGMDVTEWVQAAFDESVRTETCVKLPWGILKIKRPVGPREFRPQGVKE